MIPSTPEKTGWTNPSRAVPSEKSIALVLETLLSVLDPESAHVRRVDGSRKGRELHIRPPISHRLLVIYADASWRVGRRHATYGAHV